MQNVREQIAPAEPAGGKPLVAELGQLARPIALIGASLGLFVTVADPDIWGHVRFGMDILANRGVVSGQDPYSFTQDHAFLYHEWLGGTAMGLAYQVGGAYGLMLLKAVLAAAVLGAVWYSVRTARDPWRWGAMVLASWGSLSMLLTLRPQLWTALALVLLCRVLTAGSPRLLWTLPPMFLVWANLHGGWIVGGSLVAIWTLVAWFERRPERTTLLLVGTASLLATLANPYGLGLWHFLVETVRFERNITEWQPIWGSTQPVVVWVMTVVLVALSLRATRPGLATMLALVWLAFSGAEVARVLPLFVLATVVLLARSWPLAEESSPRAGTSVRAWIDGTTVCIVIAMALWFGTMPTCLASYPNEELDTTAAESLRGTRGRLVTYFDWGEYALWHFGPDLKVSIDGRRETLYSQATLDEQNAIAAGTPEGLSALERLSPEYVWLPAYSQVTADWLMTNGYRMDVATDRSFIAVRNDLPQLSSWNGQPTGCFPGP